MGDLPVANRTNLYGKERNHGNRFPVQYHEFDLVYLAILVDQYDCTDTTLLLAMFWEIAGEDDAAQFLDQVNLDSYDVMIRRVVS